ncbi:hypothetical protein [Streptomyces griseoruber]|nr:hypothetical protein [Streptomyces griseoruber]
MRELTKEEHDPYEDEKPFVTITSPDSELLQVAADVRPGWSAVIRGDELGKRSAAFTRREGGEVVEQLRFAAIQHAPGVVRSWLRRLMPAQPSRTPCRVGCVRRCP